MPQPIRLKRCIQCGGEWPLEIAYRRNPHARAQAERGQVYLPQDFRARCIGCELTDRNEPSPEERARRKARNTIQHHAEKYEMKPSDFKRRYGWDVEHMVEDILQVHGPDGKNKCTYCRWEYFKMGHGLDDVTIDVVDREREPYYRTNVKWCCQTCNREKASRSPEEWAQLLDYWERYERHTQKIRDDVTYGLPLFTDKTLF